MKVRSIICHIFALLCIPPENFRIITFKLEKVMLTLNRNLLCHCTVDCIIAYYPRMKSEATVTHFMFGSLFVQEVLKFITLIMLHNQTRLRCQNMGHSKPCPQT